MLRQENIAIAAIRKLTNAIATMALTQVHPSETAHKANAPMRPSQAVTMSSAAIAPNANIHTNVRPARRTSSENSRNRSEKTRRTELNAFATPPMIPSVAGGAASAYSLEDESIE